MADDYVPRKQLMNSAHAACAVNSHYVARSGHAGINVQCFQDESPPFCLPYDTGRPHFDPILVFSPTRHNLLAAANGSRVLIFNVAKKRTRCILKGNGRVIASLSFSEREHEVLATGALNGSICVWSIKQPSRPLLYLNGSPGICNNIAIHSLHAGLLATAHASRLAVWSLFDSKLLIEEDIVESKLTALTWRSRESLVCVSSDGHVAEVALGHSKKSPKVWNSPSRRQASANKLDDRSRSNGQNGGNIASSRLPVTVHQASTLGIYGMVVLPVESDILHFYSYSANESNYTELWRLRVDSQIECFALQRVESGIDVTVYTGGTHPSYSIPAPVLDTMRWSGSRARMLGKGVFVTQSRPAEGKMLPEKAQRPKAMLRSSSSREPYGRPTFNEAFRKRLAKPVMIDTAGSDEHPMIANLEPPKERGYSTKNDSPMPFLSPSVPARKNDLIAPPDEDLSLLPRSSFHSMATTASHDHDSDSDDETFAGYLGNSSSFLPGSANMPLPRTCGAAFAPNGSLLTFFPRHRRPSSAAIETAGPEKQPTDGQSIEVSKPFPSFANFENFNVHSTLMSASFNSLDNAFFSKTLSFDGQRPILDTRPSWPAKISPVKTTARALPTANEAVVSVTNLETLTATRRVLATTYNICAENSQNAADFSRSNAEAAMSVGMHEAAESWHLLAIISEPRSIQRLRGYSVDRMSPVLSPNGQSSHSVNLSPTTEPDDFEMEYAQILHSAHPLGKVWAIERLFALREQQADIQLLAFMSALLVRAFQSQKSIRQSPRKGTASSQLDTPDRLPRESESVVLDNTMIPPSRPILRASSSTPIIPEEHSHKRNTSHDSSRNTSQPPTPYLDSWTSTPPLPLPPLPRHGSRVSQSGSISPEHHRSSFSVAAKSYAASIAEKLTSYGSSPPPRKDETSLGNELSTSLPNASLAGSWSKSVSFASTLAPSGSSNRSLSLAQEEDDYDSDRTIDDNLLLTPRIASSTVSLELKNVLRFTRTQPQEAAATLSETFLAKSAIWRCHHAEQLRSWGLLQEAAELEAVFGVKQQGLQPGLRPSAVVCQGTGAMKRVTCTICYCIISTVKQLCPTCLHTTHPHCLDEFISALGDVLFTCPSGCGCSCSGIAESASAAVTHTFGAEQIHTGD